MIMAVIRPVRRLFGAPAFAFSRFYLTIDGAVKIRDAKSIWVVLYLRARQSRDRLKSYYRKQHAIERRQAI